MRPKSKLQRRPNQGARRPGSWHTPTTPQLQPGQQLQEHHRQNQVTHRAQPTRVSANCSNSDGQANKQTKTVSQILTYLLRARMCHVRTLRATYSFLLVPASNSWKWSFMSAQAGHQDDHVATRTTPAAPSREEVGQFEACYIQYKARREHGEKEGEELNG